MRILGPLVLVTACGGSSDKPVVLLDATRADSSPAVDTAAPPTSVLINSFGPPPLLLAMRDGAGPWTMLDVGATDISVTQSSFELLAVCPEGTTFTTGIAAQAVTDGAVSMPCFVGGTGTPPTTVAITGQMAQPGTVWMYGTAAGTTSPWTYALDVTPGPHDFIAADAAKLAIQRGLTISAAGAGPDVDVEQTGTPFDLAAFTLANAGASATITNDVEWATSKEFINLPGTGATVSTIPAALFGANDFEAVTVTATDGLKLQAVQEFGFGTAVTFDTNVELLPELAGVTFSGPSAAWSTLPAGFDSATLQVTGANGNIELITATPAWLASATALAIDLTDLPGYQSAWRVRMTGATHQFAIGKNVSQMTSVSSAVRDSAAFTGDKRARLRAERLRRPRR